MNKRKKPMESGFIDAAPVRIIKDGKITLKTERDLMKGDIIVFQLGDIIPADIKLLEAINLEVDEFDLTGELRPVRKTVKTSGETKICDRTDIVFKGTRVLRGYGKGVVMSTGEDTEYGKILAHSIKISNRKSYLLKYDFKSHLLRHLYLQLILFPAFILLLLKKNMDFKYAFLSYLITNVWLIIFEHQIIFNYIILKIANKNFAKRGILIKDYSIFDLLKDLDVICFDKTGVITSQDMEVTGFIIDGKKVNVSLFNSLNNNLLKYIIEGFVLCNDIIFFEKTHPLDRVDLALINFAKVQGFDVEEIRKNSERIYEIPFNSENRFMMTGYRKTGKLVFYIKGDAEVITNKCSKYMTFSGELKNIDEKFIFNITEAKKEASKSGNSIIAMAFKEFCRPEVEDLEETLSGGYIFLSLIILENPPKKEAHYVIENLKNLGIRCYMLTGDLTATALKIAEIIGLNKVGRLSITGRDVEKMSISDISEQSEYITVFSRLAPSQKGIVVEAIKRKGHKVMMVGDGANDVIALKFADIGITFKEQSSILSQKASDVLINGDLMNILFLIKTGRYVNLAIKITNITRVVILLSSLVLLITLVRIW